MAAGVQEYPTAFSAHINVFRQSIETLILIVMSQLLSVLGTLVLFSYYKERD